MIMKFHLFLFTSLLSIGMNSAFSQTRSSLPADWKSPSISEKSKNSAIQNNISSTQKISNSSDTLSKTEKNSKELNKTKPITKYAIPLDPSVPNYTPPKEIINACKTKSVGNSCEALLANGTLKGNCSIVPYSSNLVCQPPLPANLKSLPSEPPNFFPLVKACDGKPIGNSCLIDIDSKKITGTCHQSTLDSKILCKPNNIK